MMHQYNWSWALKCLYVYRNFDPRMSLNDKEKKSVSAKEQYWTTTPSFITEDASYISGRMSTLTRRIHFHDGRSIAHML